MLESQILRFGEKGFEFYMIFFFLESALSIASFGWMLDLYHVSLFYGATECKHERMLVMTPRLLFLRQALKDVIKLLCAN